MREDFLARTDHRPWPRPGRAWIWRQRWDEVWFLHWRVSERALRPLVPEGLALDRFDGSPWISVVPFRMAAVRPRGLPALRAVSDFPELNVRTYVRAGERPGVYFLRILAGNRLSAWLARRLSPLPYVYAPISWRSRAERVDFGTRGFAAELVRGASLPDPGDRERWLTERYCLYAATRRALLRADVHHAPWPLAHASVKLRDTALMDELGLDVAPAPDAAHVSPGVEVVAWSSERVARTRPAGE